MLEAGDTVKSDSLTALDRPNVLCMSGKVRPLQSTSDLWRRAPAKEPGLSCKQLIQIDRAILIGIERARDYA